MTTQEATAWAATILGAAIMGLLLVFLVGALLAL